MYELGQRFTTGIDIDHALVAKFAEFSGDLNPIHVDAVVAREFGHPKPVAHGAILVAIISRMIGMEIPGPGAVWLSQNVEWLQPVYVGDRISVTLEITEYSQGASLLTLAVCAVNHDGTRVMQGQARVKQGYNLARTGERKMDKKGLAILTGGSRGIGATIAAALAEDGYDVALIFRSNREVAKKVAASVQSFGRKCHLVRADLTIPGQGTEDLIALGPCNLFVHAASADIGTVRIDEGACSSQDLYDLHWQVTCKAAMELVRLVMPGMVEAGHGRLIFMGTSALDSSPPVGWSPYLMAKHALWGYVRSLAVELGPKGITANMISPSMIITDLTKNVPLRAKEIEARKNPVRRLAQPGDVANAVRYLASDGASFVNGQNIFLTGGI